MLSSADSGFGASCDSTGGCASITLASSVGGGISGNCDTSGSASGCDGTISGNCHASGKASGCDGMISGTGVSLGAIGRFSEAGSGRNLKYKRVSRKGDLKENESPEGQKKAPTKRPLQLLILQPSKP